MTPLGVVVVIVLVDLLGFSLVMPLLAPFAEQYGFREWQIGVLFSAYPMCQLVAGPILGRLSDRYGRRPLLILSQAGTAISFLILGLSRDYSVMLLARMLDGASGGNILVAQAYVADVTTPEDRARGMGLIGMAFGLGFVLGPLLGGLLLSVAVAEEWRLRLPFLVAACFSSVAWLLVLFWLPESVPPAREAHQAAHVASWRGIGETMAIPGVGLLVLVGFLGVLGFATFEGTFALYLRRRFAWDAQRAAFAFAGMGLWSSVVQGGLIRRLVPRYGETRLIIAGLVLAAVGFAGLATVATLLGLTASMLLVGLGQGLLRPSVSGLISRLAPEDEQGVVFGTLSSAQTLARMIGYSVSNLLLGRVSTTAPYWGSAGVDVLALAVAGRLATAKLGDANASRAPAAASPTVGTRRTRARGSAPG
jgi:DHA1 family tetracycline resistance protein-like MFS transporter